jgi:hypothetical protein
MPRATVSESRRVELNPVALAMKLPGFLTRDPSQQPNDPDGRTSSRYAKRGYLLGCLLAVFFWIVPIAMA